MAGPGFTRSHRGGEGPPMVCLHGFTDTWRTWELVLPQLEGRHEVVAPTVPGHAGGPAIEGEVSDEALVEQVETILKPRGHRARPPGGQLAGRLRCPAPRRARAGESVVALAPAGGWAADDDSYKDTLRYFLQMQKLVADAAPHADAIASSPDGRRQATRDIVTNFEHIP
ncbi:MAG: alpha/beta hydrolase, partial [Solirubrobacterales bacterium]